MGFSFFVDITLAVNDPGQIVNTQIRLPTGAISLGSTLFALTKLLYEQFLENLEKSQYIN